jgi:Ca-activated chloride channel family protein
VNTLLRVVARCEHKNVEPAAPGSAPSTLWASIKVDAIGEALERERAALAVALVVDVSGSMQGQPLEHVLKSCGMLADLLGERDQLAIVTFATHAAVRCGLTRLDNAGRAQIHRLLGQIAAADNTNLHAGLEVAAGVLMTAPAGLRRAMVVMSDGQPNVGIILVEELAAYVAGLKIAVSSLGFGLSHDENVLDAIATAGSGRYAYVPDPVLAGVDLARAALAHSGVVADQLELKIDPAEGVEVVRLLPVSPLRVGGGGLITAIGDVFIDEGRAVAVELALQLRSRATGRLAAITVSGRSADGAPLRTTASLEVDIRSGARILDGDAQREIIMVQADAARAEARAQADRGAYPAAAAILREIAKRIDAIEGFVRNDGSLIAELREQLEDEIANHGRRSSAQERIHQRKASLAYTSATPGFDRVRGHLPSIPAVLIGIGGPVAGARHGLFTETSIGRGVSNDIVVASCKLSRSHTRITLLGDRWFLQDLGTTNGSYVNGKLVTSSPLDDGDLLTLGDARFRFEIVK